MALDYNKDGKVSFADLTDWLQGETFGIKNWLMIALVFGGWLFLFAPRTIKRKFGLK